MKYTRSSIRYHTLDDGLFIPQEAVHKFTCQVFNENGEFVDYLIGDNWQDVNRKFKEKYEEAD